MDPNRTILFLFTFLFLTSCQVKETVSNGGLISGHSSTTNSFSVQTPAAKTFVAGEVVSFALTFPFDIIIDSTLGSPRLNLTIGTLTQYGVHVPQTNLRELHFSYMISPGENDSNGIDVVALELNGSTLKFNNQGVLTDCNVASVTLRNFAGQKVDTASSLITNFKLLNVPGLYNVGKRILFTITYNEAVYVTGTPKFVMSLSTGGAVDVNYESGSGSTVLTFSYTVAGSVADSNGYDSITSPLVLGIGTIKDAVGNNASLDFSSLVGAVLIYSANVVINGQYPFVVATVVPANGTYIAAQNLDVTLEFDRAVTVSGFPFINITVDLNIRQAQYLSGSGTRFITFRYTTVPGDVDPNGISIATSISQNGGNIVDSATPTVSYFTNSLNNSFIVPNTSGIILNAIQPAAISVARNVDSTIPVWGGPAVDNVWMIGQELNITVGFNTGMFVTQTGGTPTIPLTIGATTRQATYLSGGNGQTSLVFRYVILESDLDSDGTVAIGNISLNGGVITDSANTNSLLTLPVMGLTSTKIDGVKPVISNVSAPSDGTYSEVASLIASTMSFILTWSEAVNYSTTGSGAAYIPLNIGGTLVNAEYSSGTTTASLVHRPLSLATRNDSDGIVVSSPLSGTAIIKDQAGNVATVLTFTPPIATGILVDTIAPTVTSVTMVSSNGTYKAGQNIDVSVTFSEVVTTNIAGGYPRIPMTIGASTVYMLPVANATNTIHTFRYTVLSNQLDTDGIAIGNAITHNGSLAYARDAGRNNSTGTFIAPDMSGIKVDAVLPTVLSATGSTNKSYISGETVQISITYSEAVTVDTLGGTPSIAVDFTVGTDNFIYASGSGTSTLIFSRLLTATHFDMDGLPASITSIALNGGTIQDVGTNSAPTAFPNVDLSLVFVTYPEVKIWTVSNFVNRAPPIAISLANTGALENTTCGTGICRTFDGDDSLSLNAALNGVDTVLMTFKNPASIGVLVDYDIFDTDITLKGDLVANAYDLSTANANIILNGILYSGVNFNVDLPLSSTNVLQVDFTTPQNYVAGALIPNTFIGGIGEVVAIVGVLTATQKDNIRNYLDLKY